MPFFYTHAQKNWNALNKPAADVRKPCFRIAIELGSHTLCLPRRTLEPSRHLARLSATSLQQVVFDGIIIWRTCG